ncbi:SapC family protein [Sphingomonas sp. QA11]|uniref:SapC family protein n=1 Tax=Sphingomonas sp. QA11 TaxID=2950605 RepID=UPI002349DBA3|nr:SapC family protein [Sphingomonas sp. QA11]WCM25131.1 SapC family protein [Sphingomonas sp. QA11]
MAQELEILNNETHRNLRMRPDPSGPSPHFVTITTEEFHIAAITCPIFFAKDSGTGEFYAAALFGFQPGELLVDQDRSGKPVFQPLDFRRQGFFIADDGIAIDSAHARFDLVATDPLFEEDGNPSEALRRIQRVVGQLATGMQATRAFIAELLRLNLIEPIDISLKFDDGEELTLNGLYTISRDNLRDIHDNDTIALFRSGYLQAAWTMSLSVNQVATLARRRNERLAAKP